MHVHSIPCVVSAFLVAVSWASSVDGQVTAPSQQDLLEMLRSEDRAASVAAVTWISRIGADSLNPELVLALIAELERANALEAETRRQGVALETRMNPESYSFLQRVVAQTNDPRTIPVLAQALGNFGLVPFLVDYGELAAPDVLDVVTNPESDYYAVNDGLRILRMMIENQEAQALTAETLIRIRDAAEQRLTGPQYFTTVYYAIDLAGVLADSVLTQKLELIAAYDTEVYALGIEDPDTIARIQQRAADRLAGVPALPQHRSPAIN
jgi:hypothetical protein